MNSNLPYDWGKFWVHVACGAVLVGLLAGAMSNTGWDQ